MMDGPRFSLGGDQHLTNLVELPRLKSFSDGVFAIAATLLAFNVHLPATTDQSFSDLLAAIEPQIMAFLISFVVAAVYWRNHNRLFLLLDRADSRLNQINMALLAAVCLMPFTTGLIAGVKLSPGAVILYALSMALIGVLAAAQWAYVALHPALLASHVTQREIWRWFSVACVAPTIFLLSIAPANFSVEWAMRGWGVILVFLPLARRLTRR